MLKINKRILIILIILICVTSITTIWFETNANNNNINVSTKKHNITYNYKNPLEGFLTTFNKSDNFTSQRLDFLEEKGSIEETYYHLLIQELLGLKINQDILGVFSKDVIKNYEHNAEYLMYFDVILRNYNGKDNYKEKLIKHIKKNYFIRKNNFKNISPFLIYDSCKKIYNETKEKNSLVTKYFSELLLENNNIQESIILSYWYIDLINSGFEVSNKHKFVLKKIQNILLQSKNMKFNDLEVYYYYLKLEHLLNKKENYCNEVKLNIPNTIHSSEIYHTLKIISIDNDIKPLYQDYYKNFYDSFVIPKGRIYPYFIIEDNNVVEMVFWEIIMNNIYNSPNTIKLKLKDIILQSPKINSMQQMYYQVLFSHLNNIEYPKGSIAYVENLLYKKDNVVNNYYLYQCYKLLIKDTKTFQNEKFKVKMKKLKIESEKYLKEKDIWGAIHALDLWLTYDLNKNYALGYWKKIEKITPQSSTKMTLETFFHYQRLKYIFKKQINLKDIDSDFNVARYNDKYIIKGDLGYMDLNAIYYYTILTKLSYKDSDNLLLLR